MLKAIKLNTQLLLTIDFSDCSFNPYRSHPVSKCGLLWIKTGSIV